MLIDVLANHSWPAYYDKGVGLKIMLISHLDLLV